jgi:plasmid stability protein
MSMTIMIRDVPEGTHRKLKARAEATGLSLSTYILRSVARLAEEAAEKAGKEGRRKSLAALRPMKLTETPAQVVRAIRDDGRCLRTDS